MNKLEQDFYNEINHTIEQFTKTVIHSISNKNSDLSFSNFEDEYKIIQNLNLNEKAISSLKNILNELSESLIHSVFVSIDGGSSLSDNGKALELIEYKTKKPLTELSLHEGFIESTCK